MLQFSFGGSDAALVAAIQARSRRAIANLVTAMNQQDLLDQQEVIDKLSGPVLQPRTGKGAASVRLINATTDGSSVTGAVEAGGGPAFYLKFQEEGTEGPYEIKPKNKKALAFFPAGAAGLSLGSGAAAQQIFAGKRGVNRHIRNTGRAHAAFAEAGGVVVKSVMHPGLKAREFMKQTAEDSRSRKKAAFQDALARALGGHP